MQYGINYLNALLTLALNIDPSAPIIGLRCNHMAVEYADVKLALVVGFLKWRNLVPHFDPHSPEFQITTHTQKSCKEAFYLVIADGETSLFDLVNLTI